MQLNDILKIIALILQEKSRNLVYLLVVNCIYTNKDIIMNKNYIGVVAMKENGDLELIREEISKEHEDLKVRLLNMCDNSNHTLLDLQEEFSRTLNEDVIYYICMPFEYDRSYVHGVQTPSKLTYDEYQKKIERKRKELSKKHKFRKALVDNIVYTKKEWITKEIEEVYKKELKYEYYNECERFINAYNFKKTSELIKERESTKMLSTEDIGWMMHKYNVNEDVEITVRTNFGYGFASYFFLGVKYKGIEILPYTAYIYYYNANIVEIKRHTRQYSTSDRESWNLALNFVVETANLAKNNSHEFIDKWILNEVKEMYDGLVNYMHNTDTELKKFIDRKPKLMNGFWNMTTVLSLEKDEVNYKVCRNEMVTVFKAEKITGALSFLGELKKLTPYFPQIQTYINGINEMNITLRSDVEKMIEKIQIDQDRITSELEIEEKNLLELNEKIHPYINELTELLHGKFGDAKKRIENEYIMSNLEYAELKEIREKLICKIGEIRDNRDKRDNLLNRLNTCIGRIESHFAA